jgi:hypothetical protein
MTATTAPRATERLGELPLLHVWKLPMKANTKINAGSLVVIDAGYAAPGRTAAGLLIAGCAQATVDNTGVAAGARLIEVRRGCFKYVNGDAIVQADVGKDCYITDDQTVALLGTGKSRAGKIVQVETDGVFVETY